MYHDEPLEAVVHVHRRKEREHKDFSKSDRKRRLIKQYQLHRVIDFVKHGSSTQPCESESNCLHCPFRRVALQFPDDKLHDAVEVVRILQELWRKSELSETSRLVLEKKAIEEVTDLNSNSECNNSTTLINKVCSNELTLTSAHVMAAPKIGNSNNESKTRFFILADNTFASCCPDEITAAHYHSDSLVHFGDACMSRSIRLPVLYIHDIFHFQAVKRAVFAMLIYNKIDNKKEEVVKEENENENVEEEEDDDDEEHTRIATTLSVQIVKTCVEWIIFTLKKCIELNATQLQSRLVIIGTHATKQLLENAKEELMNNSGEYSDILEWCTFASENQNDVKHYVNEISRNDNNADDSVDNTEISCKDDVNVDMWTVNGVNFKRLHFSSTNKNVRDDDYNGNGTKTEIVQFFIFVGPSNSSHLLHLAHIQRYNEYHYSEMARSFVERVSSEGFSAFTNVTTHILPRLCVIDETFGNNCNLHLEKNMNLEEMKEVDRLFVYNTLCAPDNTQETCANVMRCAVTVAADKQLCMTESSVNLHCDLQRLYTSSCHERTLQMERRIRQRDFNVECVKASDAIGIVVAALSIADYYEVTMLLHKFIRSCNKRSYIIYIGHLNEFKLANFVDTVDCFVAIACPNNRECYFATKEDNYLKPVVTPLEVILALSPETITVTTVNGKQSMRKVELFGSPAAFSTSLELVVPLLHACLAVKDKAHKKIINHVERTEREDNGSSTVYCTTAETIITDNIDNNSNGDDDDDDVSYALISSSASHALSQRGASGALERLHQRSFVGLDLQLGKTEVQKSIIEGKYGIACQYDNEQVETSSTMQSPSKKEV